MQRTKQKPAKHARVLAAFLSTTTAGAFLFSALFAGLFVADGAISTTRGALVRPVSIAARVGGAGLAVSAAYGSVASPSKPPTPIAGKGMWIWLYDTIFRGDPDRIVRYAVAHGLSHIYVRSGSSNVGLKGWEDVAEILPAAHRAGLKVIAWDFPYLRDPGADVRRARWVLNQKVAGHSVDGFAADVETRSEGTVLTRFRARRYANWLRAVSPGKFIILVPPRPNPYTVSFYPYDVLVPKFDAVAPMVYWGKRKPNDETRWAINYLKRFGKPVAPIGQSFDMGPEGGPKGPPSSGAVIRFMVASQTDGAVGVSFWSWQHTPRYLWETIRSYRWQGRK